MHEDHSVEEKYLYNFSQKERELFHKEQQKKCAQLAKYEPTVPNSPLEVKYILNRIAANDPRDTSFELAQIDCIKNADQWASSIAQAFENNTFCKKIILKDIGLTDEGLLPILNALKDKQLNLLDIAKNKVTDKSYDFLNKLLSDPQNKWKKVNLGQIRTSPELAHALKKHPCLSFSPIVRYTYKSDNVSSDFIHQRT